MLWTNKFTWDLSLSCISDRYPILHKAPGSLCEQRSAVSKVSCQTHITPHMTVTPVLPNLWYGGQNWHTDIWLPSTQSIIALLCNFPHVRGTSFGFTYMWHHEILQSLEIKKLVDKVIGLFWNWHTQQQCCQDTCQIWEWSKHKSRGF